MFDFGSRSNPIVLILDRKDDPVTPLLTQWTYQAMIHELIGLNDGTARLKSAKLTDEESRNIVLDPSQVRNKVPPDPPDPSSSPFTCHVTLDPSSSLLPSRQPSSPYHPHQS